MIEIPGVPPAIHGSRFSVYQGDCRKILCEIPTNSIHSIVTDPPYELRLAQNEQIRDWDKTGVAFDVEVWAQCLRVLKPGGHALIFGGPRTWHRMACAIEDAGLEILSTIAWLYGTGLPKNAGLADEIGSINPEARDKWLGWSRGLKPGFEPIIVARKPTPGNIPTAYNVLVHGTGAINIDACKNEAGRHPTNVLLDQDAADQLDAVVGERRTGGTARTVFRVGDEAPGDAEDAFVADAGFARVPRKRTYARTDPGLNDKHAGASKYFPVFRYQPKAPASERPKVDGITHPTVKPLDLIRWCVRLVTPPDGVVLDPFGGSGTTAEAAQLEGFQCVMIENEPKYLPLIEQRMNRRNDRKEASHGR